MPEIRVKPEEGQWVIINKQWFDHNSLIAQYFPDMKPMTPYQILNIDTLEGTERWGITSLVEYFSEEDGGNKVFDIADIPELSDYYCLLDEDDSYKVLAENPYD